MKFLFIFYLLVAFTSKIPIQAVELSDALKDEGERMHLLNLALVDKIFQPRHDQCRIQNAFFQPYYSQ